MRTLLFALVVLWSLAGSDSAADYFPFVEGVRYDYQYEIHMGSGTCHRAFSGIAEVGGAVTRVQRWGGDALHDGLLHFWSETDDGDKFFHGSQSHIESEPYSWTPPIPMLDAPLFLGKTWTVDTQSSDGLSVHIDFEVIAFGDVTVPAGVFKTFTVQDTWQFPKSKADVALARFTGVPGLVGGVPYRSTRSYADGIGLVLDIFGDGGRTDRLLAIHTVGVEAATWTRIRGLYR